eukprot:6354098-Alexandrium_andersonii.AAC.1
MASRSSPSSAVASQLGAMRRMHVAMSTNASCVGSGTGAEPGGGGSSSARGACWEGRLKKCRGGQFSNKRKRHRHRPKTMRRDH